jgi:putative transport protein
VAVQWVLGLASATTRPASSGGWLRELFTGHGVAHAVLLLGLVAAAGLAVGAIKVYRLNLGVAGVLFAGLAFAHFGFRIDAQILEFVREFGLILFVYTIGVQVGPGFLASLRRNGLPLNLLATAVIVLGVLVTLAIGFLRFEKKDRAIAVGLFSGAVTNTPSLGAAKQATKDVPSLDAAERERVTGNLDLAYTMTYPFGILGIIVSMLLVKGAFKISTAKEADALRAQQSKEGQAKLDTMNLEVRNANLDGLALRDIPTIGRAGVVISRVLKGAEPQVARGETTLRLGDVLLAVGPRDALEELKLIIGAETAVDARAVPSNLTTRRVLVSKSGPLGRTIPELDPMRRFGVIVTRVHRAEVELPATNATPLQFGDNLVVVGEPEAIKTFAGEVGDSPKQLNHPQIIPVFLGIALGVILGSWPFAVPGMSSPVRLGLAGGPLIVAIVLSRLGNIGPLVWYMPLSANFMLRELGIVLFLASVGLKSGDRFVATMMSSGLEWMAYGAIITLVPLIVVGVLARWLLKMNFLTLCGLMSGSMTDPPALAFAGAMTGSDAPSVAYATVYPLVILLRVVAAQVMILVFFG